MKISDGGVDFIRRWEGLATSAYCDIAGVWTIGYGHTAGFRDGRFRYDSVIDPGAAELLLRADLAPREETVCRLVRVGLDQHAFDALVSFEFNTGALARSTALRRLNEHDRQGAAEALTWWSKATIDGVLRDVPGLQRRRAAEARLLLKMA